MTGSLVSPPRAPSRTPGRSNARRQLRAIDQRKRRVARVEPEIPSEELRGHPSAVPRKSTLCPSVSCAIARFGLIASARSVSAKRTFVIAAHDTQCSDQAMNALLHHCHRARLPDAPMPRREPRASGKAATSETTAAAMHVSRGEARNILRQRSGRGRSPAERIFVQAHCRSAVALLDMPQPALIRGPGVETCRAACASRAAARRRQWPGQSRSSPPR